MKKTLATLALTAVAVLLSACSVPHADGDASINTTSASSADGSNASGTTYGLSTSASYRQDANGFKINSLRAPSNQTYYFSFADSSVKQSDMDALLAQANFLAAHPNASVRLEGNTDNRGSREYNIGLGWRRDQSVARIMEQQGVRPKQIQMVSYGKQNPAVAQNNERAWALNRRVVMIYKTR